MTRISYNIRQAFRQINRNKGMALASIFAITAMMLILGLFFVISVNINLFTEVLKNDYNQIEIYLEDTVSPQQSEAISKEIQGYEGVKDVRFRSKEEAMEIMKKRWGKNGYILDSLGENPFPNSLLVQVETVEAANATSEKAATIPGVEDVKFYRETVEKLAEVSRLIQLAALTIMVFLLIVSVVVVSNTIKLTVFAREREIEIMKYIGATNWFIRGPLLAEGILIGFLSSLVAALVTYVGYSRIMELINKQLLTILSIPLVPANYLSVNLVAVFLALGISIGACGSLISMRKFLDT